MFWIILLVALTVLAVVSGFFASRPYTEEEPFVVGCIASTLIAIAIGLCVIRISITNNSNLNQFQQQKEYIENHQPTGTYDDAAITTKKIEYNEWLFNAQYRYENYWFFTLIPQGVMDLEPIQ